MAEAATLSWPETIIGDDPVPVRGRSGARVLHGVPTSRGRCTGAARVVTSLATAPDVGPDDVLVLEAADVTWTPLLLRAGAVVTETGGMLSHASIVARELGIPCVASVAGATEIVDGTEVSVDGGTGEVLLLDREARHDVTGSRLTDRTALAIGAITGYLTGSVSFSRLVGERAAPGQDLNVTLIDVAETGTTVEFHGVTPTSVKEHAGGRAMMASIAMEAAKAALPTLVARVVLPGTPAAPAAATGAVVGHVFPMWSGFRGGYGMSPMLGGLLVLDPLGLVVTTAGLSAVIGLTRDRRLMMLWPVTVPLWGAARGRKDLVLFGTAANVVYWARLVPELRRGLRSVLSVGRPRTSRSGQLDVASPEHGHAEEGQPDSEEDQRPG